MATLAHATYSFVTFAYPGTYGHQAWSINRHLQIPGNATLSSTNLDVGFIYDVGGNSFHTLPAGPTGFPPIPLGINDYGKVVGSFYDGSFDPYVFALTSFVWNGTSYSTFNRPGHTVYARGINNAGIITGYSEVLMPGAPLVGWIYDPATGVFTDLPIAGDFTIAQGINSAGEVVGSAVVGADAIHPGSAPGAYGWLRSSSGVVTYFRINGQPTRARAINDTGQIGGYVGELGVDPFKGFVTSAVTPTGGYIEVPLPASEYISVPGSLGTQVQGINNAGHVSGMVYLADNSSRGFVGMPPSVVKLTALTATIKGFGLPTGTENSFTSKLDAVHAAIAAGETSQACDTLKAVQNHARAQSGKKLTPAQAARITDDAAEIRSTLGC